MTIFLFNDCNIYYLRGRMRVIKDDIFVSGAANGLLRLLQLSTERYTSRCAINRSYQRLRHKLFAFSYYELCCYDDDYYYDIMYKHSNLLCSSSYYLRLEEVIAG